MKSVAPILATSLMRKNRVLEKFAPNLDLEQSSQSSDKETQQTEKPQALRRTQSTKILDLAASLFQPGDEIQTGEKKSPLVEKKSSSKSQVSRSQTMKLLSPPMQARRQSQDSFIRELLEMAKTDSGTSPLGQKNKEVRVESKCSKKKIRKIVFLLYKIFIDQRLQESDLHGVDKDNPPQNYDLHRRCRD